MTSSLLQEAAIITGGPRAGFAGDTKVPLPTKTGEILVCLAQRGECRYNHRHYRSGMHDEVSWTLPQIEPGCDRQCLYRRAVANPKKDTQHFVREGHWDPYGFTYYKVPADACPKTGLAGHEYRRVTCPQCSKPEVEPTDDWIDVVAVDQYCQHGDMMRMMGGKEHDHLEHMSATPATKQAIRQVLDQT